MKNTNQTTRWLAYGLCLATTLYNCKTKEVASVTPLTYTFSGLDNVKLPDLTPTAPAAVSVTAATITVSPMTAALNAGLKDIAATGQVPAVVKDAASTVSAVVSTEKMASLAAAFTPDVINSLTSKGELPASLKADVNTIASNAAVKAYLPTYTLPQVNGKAVGARTGVNPLVPVANAVQDASTDACSAAANAAYTTAVGRLDAARTTQTAAVNATYTQYETADNAEVPSCQSGVPAKYVALTTTAKTDLDATIANLTASREVLGEALFNTLSVLSYVTYSQTIQVYTTLMAAETNACSLTRDAKVAAAKAAQTTDLNVITTNYNTSLSDATTARDKAIAGCHNQGNGG